MVFVRLIVNFDFPPASVCCIINVQWLAYIFNIQQSPNTVILKIEIIKKYVSVMMIDQCKQNHHLKHCVHYTGTLVL